jgi:4'-phosphopantetheinyl transferase EntD
LLVEERTLLEGATHVRQREIAAGRVLAHRLMERAGYVIGPVMQHATGAPLWPKGLCGSIAHSNNTIAVALAPISSMRSVGIDIEDGRDLGDAVSDVTNEDEVRAMMDHGLASEAAGASRLLFSAKEALFKCQSVITGDVDLSFGEIRLQMDAAGYLRGTPRSTVSARIAAVASQIRIIIEEFQSVTLAVAWLGLT